MKAEADISKRCLPIVKWTRKPIWIRHVRTFLSLDAVQTVHRNHLRPFHVIEFTL